MSSDSTVDMASQNVSEENVETHQNLDANNSENNDSVPDDNDDDQMDETFSREENEFQKKLDDEIEHVGKNLKNVTNPDEIKINDVDSEQLNKLKKEMESMTPKQRAELLSRMARMFNIKNKHDFNTVNQNEQKTVKERLADRLAELKDARQKSLPKKLTKKSNNVNNLSKVTKSNEDNDDNTDNNEEVKCGNDCECELHKHVETEKPKRKRHRGGKKHKKTSVKTVETSDVSTVNVEDD
jgi:hypothetical protein